jgi:cell pole-organizing protein PopZ
MGDINREPSMEEILASIKRVIAEDGRTPSQPRLGRKPQAVPEPAPEPAEEDVLELSDPVSEENGLLSNVAKSASQQALAALSALQKGETPEPPAAAVTPTASDAPLEALVREMLKPMLKDWLDQRLPDMVEELVTREIARITGKHL